MSHKMSFPTPPPDKTTGQKVADYAIILILVSFIVYVLQKLFELLLKPLQYLLMRPEDYQELDVEKAREKKENRDKRIELFKSVKYDPMVQYRNRYIDHPEEYTDESENKKYLEWYKEWKGGNVIDEELRWAPPVYIEKELNPDFITYVDLQAKACKGNRRFLKTIQDFYPELTPKFPAILNDIKELRTIKEEAQLHDELFDELTSMGLSSGLANEVMKMDPSVIQESAQFLKKCSEFKYTDSVCMTLLKTGVDPDSEIAVNINRFMTELLIPSYVMVALFKGDIEGDDVVEIGKRISSTCEMMGTSFSFTPKENGKCIIEELIELDFDRAIKRVREKKMNSKIEEKA